MNAQTSRRHFLGIGAAGLAGLLVNSCSRKGEQVYHWKSIAFDTEISVKIVGIDAALYTKVIPVLSARVSEIEGLFSLYLTDSWLSRLNANGVVNEAPQEFTEMITRSISYAESTHGLFDVSVQPLWEYYQEGERSLDEALKLVDISNVVVEGNTVKFTKVGMKLTLNGLVQGYLTDALMQEIKEHGVKNALVNGGEFRALGDEKPSSGDTGWEVQIMGHDAVIATLRLQSGESLAVSAGYGDTFAIGSSAKVGRHLFHPSNAVKSSVNMSRTFVVIANTAEKADVYATSLAVATEAQWLEIGSSVKRYYVYEGSALVSP